MAERLPCELRVLHEVARAGGGSRARGEVLTGIAESLAATLGFERVRVLDRAEEAADERALAAARTLGAAAARGDRVAVPLLGAGCSFGFLVADRGGRELRPPEAELRLLSAAGLLAAALATGAEQQERLREALVELRRLDALKDELVAVASHELRTPIAIVHGIALTLHERAGELDEARAAALRAALVEQSDRLRGLAEQLLDLSRADAAAPAERRRFRPRRAVEELLPRVAAERAADVDVRVDPRLELVCDACAFERVVGNLVANALAHGRPPVLVEGSGGAGAFRLTVEDRGPGVDPEFVPRLFDRFTRADGTRRAGAAGAGLGLAIARRYAEALGGELSYEPAAPSGGARFVLVVPAGSRPSERREASEAGKWAVKDSNLRPWD